jgi:hypothetical protein
MAQKNLSQKQSGNTHEVTESTYVYLPTCLKPQYLVQLKQTSANIFRDLIRWNTNMELILQAERSSKVNLKQNS